MRLKKKNVFAKPCLVTHKQIRELRQQVFVNDVTKKEIEKLQSSLQNHKLSVTGREVTLILCGEIHAFKADGTVKHGGQFELADNVINPTHTPMTRWGLLGQKLEALSVGRVVIHLTNNTSPRKIISTDLRVYKNGNLDLEPKPQSESFARWIDIAV